MSTVAPDEWVNPLRDKRVRLAISKAINRDAIIQSLYGGAAKAANCVYTVDQFVPEGIETFAYDPEKAKQLLAEAGYPDGEGLGVAGGTFFLIVLPISRQQGSTDVHEADFTGLQGQVTSEIPEGGLGRVTVIAPTSKARIGLPARSADGQRIPFGATVRIEMAGPGPAVVTPSSSPATEAQ